ncbi:helix-turn-helix domain-containing protein [Chryseobacterium artocarpi]|nr:helix-turn-helix transcriptional regulator [Chryseobacterium artocarpi]
MSRLFIRFVVFNIHRKMEAQFSKEEMLKKLGDRIKQLRINKGYSSYEYFAYEHNISRAQFGRYERGEDLRFSSLIKVINALDLTLAEFFAEGFD